LKAKIANRSAQSKVCAHGDDFFSVNATVIVEIASAIEIQREFASSKVAQKSAAHNHHVNG
ncbi:MAG: hypothetical protein EB069_04325, partial [Actinobacteria bacterium]|nr:hypothetical protein [Actinomycetota bacterium]